MHVYETTIYVHNLAKSTLCPVGMDYEVLAEDSLLIMFVHSFCLLDVQEKEEDF